jgi:hypothetical protein
MLDEFVFGIENYTHARVNAGPVLLDGRLLTLRICGFVV